jgi:hypothetical protein
LNICRVSGGDRTFFGSCTRVQGPICNTVWCFPANDHPSSSVSASDSKRITTLGHTMISPWDKPDNQSLNSSMSIVDDPFETLSPLLAGVNLRFAEWLTNILLELEGLLGSIQFLLSDIRRTPPILTRSEDIEVFTSAARLFRQKSALRILTADLEGS